MTDLKSPIDKYLEKLESYHNGIQFPGLPDRIEVNGCELLSLFVMPRVKRSKSKGKQTRRAVSFDTMFRKDGKRKFVILGKPGAGKTTLLKYLMLEAAQKYLEDKKKGIASKQKLPLFVHIDSFLSHLSIRDNLKGRDDSIVSPLYGIFEEEYKIALPSGFLEEKLESGSVLLLFDGLDKVQDENRKKTMRSYIESLDARYPGGNTIIVATRPALCKRDSLLLKDYLHLELEDFNDKEIVQYLHAWYGSLEPDQHIAWAEELKRIIDSKVYLKEIAKTPLYLALIGRMHRYESRLPMDRLPLYNHIAKLLLSYAPHTADGPESKRLLLAKTAFYIQELAVKENRSAITRKELHEILTPNMIETLHGDNRQVETQVDEFLEEMQTQSGFLVEDAPDTFRFSYKTFQEYFASKWIVDENSASGDFNYTPYSENPARHETLMFVLAALPEDDAKKILTQILEKGNVPPFYLKSVNLENIKCFKGKHDLNLSHDDKTHAQWTVLLGNNGTGKTTLLQAIASLDPLRLKSVYEITSHDVRNQEFEIAAGGGKNTFLKKVRGKVAYDLKNKSAAIRFFVRYIDEIYGRLIPRIELDKLDALTIYAYGATRKASDGALTGETNTNRHDNLFSNTDLMNPEEWLAQFDYSAKRDGGTATLLLERIKKILLDILPDVKAFAIKGRSDYSSYVEFETDYGPVRFKDLSLGYRVMISWVVDLTRRMFVRYPGKPDPLAQPAIVLVDEIDLHLHPSWQRNIINYLSKHFKKTQFIVTAHSPLIVQSAQRINVVLLQKDMEKEAVYITNDINATYTGWTLEEILNDLMGLEKTVSDEYIELTKTFGQAVYNEDAETAKRVYKQLDKLLHPENHLRKLLRIQMAGLGGSDLE